MRKLASLTAAASMVAVFGFAGSTWAADQIIVDGDAESGLTNWNTSGAEVQTVGSSSSGFIPTPNGGSNFFSLGEAAAGAAFLDQDVGTSPQPGVWGCGVEGLQGSFTVNGFGASADTDEGLVTVSFFDPLGNFLGLSSVPAGDNSGGFGAFVIGSALVLENSADMNVELAGTLGGGDSNGLVDVGYDDVSVALTGCLDSFVKISGKVKGTGGTRGQFSFEGTVGIAHVGGAVVGGPIHINYKSLKFSCDFTPTALTFFGTTALVVASYACTGTGPTDGSATAALIRLVPGTGGSNSGGSGKDRGDVCVDANDAVLAIGTSPCDDDSDAVSLKNGNVHTDDDTSNGPLI